MVTTSTARLPSTSASLTSDSARGSVSASATHTVRSYPPERISRRAIFSSKLYGSSE